MYAQLCKRLSEEAPNFEPPDQPNTFRKLLLANCKSEFDKRIECSNYIYENYNDPLTPEDEDRFSTAKRKMLGNIKFIGELGKLEIVSEAILHECIKTLLQNIWGRHKASSRHNQQHGPGRDVSEDVECLTQIMRTCGRILDSSKGEKLMQQYFDRMQQLADNTEFPLRIRFMLKDIIELRRDKWVPRKVAITEGPVPINQIRGDDMLPLPRGGGGFGGLPLRPSPNAGLDGLFRNPLKTRAGLDDVLGVGMGSTLVPASNLGQGYLAVSGAVSASNGFPGTNLRYNSNRGGPNVAAPTGLFSYNNTRNNYLNATGGSGTKPNNQHFTNGGGPKEIAPRFKKATTAATANTAAAAALSEDTISLRPAANFKPPQPKPMPQLMTPLLPTTAASGALSHHHHPPPHPMSKEPPPIVIKQTSGEKGKGGRKGDKGPSKEEVLTRIKGILEKCLAVDTIDDCVKEMKEIKFPERHQPHVLVAVLKHTLKGPSEVERHLSVKLIAELKKSGVVHLDKLPEAFREMLNGLTEVESEVAVMQQYAAGVLKEAIRNELITLAAVAELTEGGSPFPLFYLVLQALHRDEGDEHCLRRFNESKVNLLQQLPEEDRSKERLAEELAERQLSFLQPLSTIQTQLWTQLQVDSNPTLFYKWLKENIDASYYTNPEFIFLLASTLFKFVVSMNDDGDNKDAAKDDKEKHDREKNQLEKFKPVLQAFLHDRSDLQMAAVYAAQVMSHALHFPKGMLLRWFMNLYDLEIVEEEAFMKWREDIAYSDVYLGKREALFQVNQWLIWLAEAEEEEEDDEDADE